jgi:hypothetical protein
MLSDGAILVACPECWRTRAAGGTAHRHADERGTQRIPRETPNAGFTQRLAELGWIDGPNLRMEAGRCRRQKRRRSGIGSQ